jgi:hypothetical protein
VAALSERGRSKLSRADVADICQHSWQESRAERPSTPALRPFGKKQWVTALSERGRPKADRAHVRVKKELDNHYYYFYHSIGKAAGNRIGSYLAQNVGFLVPPDTGLRTPTYTVACLTGDEAWGG